MTSSVRPPILRRSMVEGWPTDHEVLVLSFPMPTAATELISLLRLYRDQAAAAANLRRLLQSPEPACLAKKLILVGPNLGGAAHVAPTHLLPRPGVAGVLYRLDQNDRDREQELWAAMVAAKMLRKRSSTAVHRYSPASWLEGELRSGRIGVAELVDASFVVGPFPHGYPKPPLLCDEISRLHGQRLFSIDATGFTSRAGNNWKAAYELLSRLPNTATRIPRLHELRLAQDAVLRAALERVHDVLVADGFRAYNSDGDSVAVEADCSENLLAYGNRVSQDLPIQFSVRSYPPEDSTET